MPSFHPSKFPPEAGQLPANSSRNSSARSVPHLDDYENGVATADYCTMQIYSYESLQYAANPCAENQAATICTTFVAWYVSS
jgi:hypothetical protein